MRFLVVGGGGREHALAWKLAQEAEVICAPGNPGISDDVECVPVRADDFHGILKLAQDRDVDAVVVGPEDPLVNGLGDFLRGHGVDVYGPNQAAAQLEGSKAFSKDLMAAAQVPTAAFRTFHHADAALEYVRTRFAEGYEVCVKASGNALGKGVVVCDDVQEAEDAVNAMMVDHIFGSAGETVVIEDRLNGPEFSLLTLVGDHNFVSLPVAQDHKRVGDGNTGPNTGGMGVFSPVPWVTDEMVAEVEERIVKPVLVELRRRGIPYRGTLFTGAMLHNGRPNCLEYNVRFGDPETQGVMGMLSTGFANAVLQAATGETIESPSRNGLSAVTVVVASGGYPGEIKKGLPIALGPIPADAKLFHAGTSRNEQGDLVTSGGRVIAASAYAVDHELARASAYEAARAVKFDGAFYRNDIGG